MQRAAPYLFPAGAQLGKHNVVLHASARRHSVQSYAGPLSIKTVLRGRVSWVVAGRDLVVSPTSFLVLAEGERYSMEINETRPVETCCAFFAPGFLEQVALDLTSSAQAALDAPARIAPPLTYLSALHGDRERTLTNRVATLAEHCQNQLNPSATEEDFLMLGTVLLEFYQQIRAQVERVPSLRSSTREELFRRLLVGRDYIHSHYSESVSLTNVARAACLSLFHFHRGFTLAFAETPHSYLTRLRLAQAREMIEKGSSVLEACVAVGFSSPSAFSRLFRARLGQSPSQVRRKIRKIGQDGARIFRHNRTMITPFLATAALFAAAVITQSPVPAPSLKASMIVLGVSDVTRALEFYRDTLGLSLAPAPGDLPMLRSGDLTIVLNGGLSPSSGGFELVFPVASVSTVRKQLADRGCIFLGGPREVAPNMWAATFSDPDGHHLTLFGAR